MRRHQKRILLAVLAAGLSAALFGQQPPTPPAPFEPIAPQSPLAHPEPELDEVEQAPIEPVKTLTPADGVFLAAADLQTDPLLQPEDRIYQRYFLTQDNSKEFHGAFAYVLNATLSHATTLYRPEIRANGYLIRIDLRRLWPRRTIYDKLFPLYEQLDKIDPYFHVTGEIEFEGKTVVKTPSKPYVVDGKTYNYTSKEVVTIKKLVGTEHALHLLGAAEQKEALGALVAATASKSPILRADWFIVKMTSVLNDGQYYNFRQVQRNPKGQTAEQAWLADMGVSLDAVAKIRSDQRIGKWRSNVTGKPRAVEYFYGSGTRASIGPLFVTLTRDWFDGKIDVKRHPIFNLLNYKFDGTEAIGMLPNGMLFFVLFDGKGNLVDVAPQTLVTDSTVPAPYTANLQPMISCLRCHGPTDNYMAATNDVWNMTHGNFGGNIPGNFFDDESAKEDPIDTLDRLAGLYSGNIKEPIRIARDTHAKATFICTGGMEIPQVTSKLSQIFTAYQFTPITPQAACQELGWNVAAATAVTQFDKILPKLPLNARGVNPETPPIMAIRAWTKKEPLFVNRDDWEQVFPDAMLRVITESVKQNAQEGAKP